jgi:sugar (pentulose or hexulose) kinase
MDIGALVGGGVALLVGVLSWTQSRATNRRSDFTAITERLDRELKDERTQRKLLTSFVLDLLRWAQRVEPESQAGPPPVPPADLDLSPWRR